MGRLRLAAVECNCKEKDRQLKEQFIHRFSDNDMLAETIKELVKAKETTAGSSEQVLVWTKQSCSYCDSSHPARQCPTYRKKCVDCGKINHLRVVCRGRRNRTIHDIEWEPDQHHEE